MKVERFFLFLGLLALPALGQVTEASLKASYAEAADGTFVIAPQARMKVAYGLQKRACFLVISGKVSDREIMRTFDTAVPVRLREGKKLEFSECTGKACEDAIVYDNVQLTIGSAAGGERPTPAAVVLFKRPDCAAARDSKDLNFHSDPETNQRH